MIENGRTNGAVMNNHVGAGDAAIENAVALAKQNKVIIVNRKGEFARIKQGNLSLIEDSIEKGVLTCMYSASPVRVDPGSITLATPDGEVEETALLSKREVACQILDRVEKLQRASLG